MDDHKGKILAARLVSRGDLLAIVDGELRITPFSGKPVDERWLNEHKRALVKDIVLATQHSLFEYIGHRTGVNKGYSQDRLTMQFVEVATGEQVVQHFNVSVRYARATARHAKGSRLPEGRFIPPQSGGFKKFWVGTGLEQPRKRSEFHGKLHLLKPLFFSGEKLVSLKGNRFEDKSISLANIDEQSIHNALIGCQQTASRLPRDCQQTAKEGCQGNTAIPYSQRARDESNYVSEKVRLKLISTTCKENVSNPVQDQSTDEWLADYGEV